MRLWVWMLAAVPAFWFAGYTRIGQGDLWWHIASGQWMLANKQIIRHDVFSYSAFGDPCHQHEWLAGLIYAIFVECFGLHSLVYWKWTVVVGIFSLFFRLLVVRSGKYGSAFLATVMAAWVAAPFLDFRPQLWTFFCYAVLLNLYFGSTKTRWFIPVLFVVWVNLHGGFFFGLMMLGGLLLPDFLTEERGRAFRLLAASIAATLINPFGMETFLFPLHYALDSANPYLDILEWKSPFTWDLLSPLYPYLVVVFVVAVVIWYRSPSFEEEGNRAWAILGIVLLSLLMSFKSMRFIPIFAVNQLLILGPAMAHLWRPPKVPAWLGPSLVLAVGIHCIWPYPKGPGAFPIMTTMATNPVDVCDFLEVNKIEGKVFTRYNWGGYLDLRGGGKWKVYMDSRADTVFDRKIFLDYLKVVENKPGWLAVIEDSGAEFFLWPHRHPIPLQGLSRTGRWRVLYEDAVAALMVRRGVELPPRLELPPESPQRLMAQGVLSQRQENWVESERHLLASVDLEPNGVSLGYLLFAQEKQGKMLEMVETRKALDRLYPRRRWVSRTVYSSKTR